MIDKKTVCLFVATYFKCCSDVDLSAWMEIECFARTSSMDSRPEGPIGANVICVWKCALFSQLQGRQIVLQGQ